MTLIRIHVLRCGTVGTDETIPDRSASRDPLAFTGLMRGDKHKVWLPVYTYLIEHPAGNVLVDTGWHTDVRTDRVRHLSWELDMASKAVLPPGEAVSEQLDRLGLSASQIDTVLLTHLDVDHVSGLELVKDAKTICAHPAELRAASRHDIRYHKQLWQNIPIAPLNMTQSETGPNGLSFDVFGDSSVIFVDLAGHSDGTTGVIIQNEGRFVILTSDACYNRQNRELLKLQGITTDRDSAMRALVWIQKMSRKPGCVEILSTHDPETEPHTIEL